MEGGGGSIRAAQDSTVERIQTIIKEQTSPEAAIPGLHAKMVEHIRWLEAEFKLVASDFAEFSMHSAHRTAETDPMHSTFI